MAISLVLYGGQVLQWGVLKTLGGLVVLIVIATVFIATKGCTPGIVYGAFFVAWLVSGVYLFVQLRRSELLLTHLLPAGLVFGGMRAMPAVRDALRVPFVIPVGFILVLAPLLTEDPWRLAAAATSRFGWFAAIAITPLVCLSVLSIWRSVPVLLVSQAGSDLARVGRPEEEVADLLVKVATADERKQFRREDLTRLFEGAYEDEFRFQNTFYLTQAFEEAFRWHSLRELLRLLIGSATATFVLIYALAWAAMPLELAADWAKVPSIPTYSIKVFGFTASAPLGVFLAVPTLFTIVAVTGLLALSATEERYSDAIHSFAVRKRADRLILVGLPYIKVAGPEKFPC